MIKSHPSLLAAVIRHNLVPPGRVYKLLQAIDTDGRGLFLIENIKKVLCNKRSDYFICSWRWMRQLLDRGEGIFWDRHTDGRLWLRGPRHVALALDVDRLHGKPVYIPINALLGGIKEVTAHFFASFESGRKQDTPISQKSLRKATGAAERTQYEYNKLLGRQAKKNFTITGLEYNKENVYELTINRHKTVLQYVDRRRLRHSDDTPVCLYRLPDTRSRVHEQAPKGSLRSINAAINLAITRGRGKYGRVNRMYHPSVEAAAKSYGRNPDSPHYWPIGKAAFPNASRVGKFEAVTMWGVV